MRPSSRICSRMLKTSGCAFSTSSKSTTLYGLRRRLSDRELELELTDAARRLIIERGYDPQYGARPLRRFLQSSVETLVARSILSGELKAGDTLVIDEARGELSCMIR